MFRRALDHLDAAMIAAGEPRSTVSGSRRNSTNGAITAGPSTGQGSSIGGRGGGGSGDRRVLSASPTPGAAAAAPSPAAPGGPLVAVAQQCSRLIFEMFYITDELLYYALKHEGFVGEFALRLANLVYSVVFRHKVKRRRRTETCRRLEQANAPTLSHLCVATASVVRPSGLPSLSMQQGKIQPFAHGKKLSGRGNEEQVNVGGGGGGGCDGCDGGGRCRCCHQCGREKL